MANASEYLTLEEAARTAGYRNASSLRKAAREGQLRSVRLGPRAVVTTAAWLEAYHATLNGKGGRPRGSTRPATAPDPADAAARARLVAWLTNCASPAQARELLTLLAAADLGADQALAQLASKADENNMCKCPGRVAHSEDGGLDGPEGAD